MTAKWATPSVGEQDYVAGSGNGVTRMGPGPWQRALVVVAFAAGAVMAVIAVDSAQHKAPAQPRTQWMVVDGTQSGDVPAGDRLDIVMGSASETNVARCDDMGGELIESPTGVTVCESVDH